MTCQARNQVGDLGDLSPPDRKLFNLLGIFKKNSRNPPKFFHAKKFKFPLRKISGYAPVIRVVNCFMNCLYFRCQSSQNSLKKSSNFLRKIFINRNLQSSHDEKFIRQNIDKGHRYPSSSYSYSIPLSSCLLFTHMSQEKLLTFDNFPPT